MNYLKNTFFCGDLVSRMRRQFEKFLKFLRAKISPFNLCDAGLFIPEIFPKLKQNMVFKAIKVCLSIYLFINGVLCILFGSADITILTLLIIYCEF